MIRLDNGLAVVAAPRRSAPVVSVWTFFRCGSGDELAGEHGLAHLLEHMMFKTTRDLARGEIDALTHRHGGQNNAYTTVDATAYHFDLPAKHLDVALRIEASRMRGLALDDAELAAERNVVLEEIAISEDDPESRLVRVADTLTFPGHPYGHPILGSAGDIATAEAEAVRAFYDRNYRPCNAVLVVAGDFDEADLQSRVECRFGRLASGEPPPRERPAAPVAGGRAALEEDVEVARLLVQFPGIARGDPHEAALDVAAQALAPGRASRLFRRLVPRHAAEVNAENDARLGEGVFTFDVEAVPGADRDRLERALFEELSRIAADGPSEDELARARTVLLAELTFRREVPSDIAEDLGECAVLEGLSGYEEYPRALQRVTTRDVASACRLLLDREPAVVWSVPS